MEQRIKRIAIALGLFLGCFLLRAQSIALPEGCECLQLIDGQNTLPDVNYLYRDISNGTGVILLHNLAFILGDNDLDAAVLMPWDRPITDARWYDGDCFFACDSTIYHCDSLGIAQEIIMAESPITSFDVYDKGIVFSIDSFIGFYSFLSFKVEPLFHAEASVLDVECLGENVLFSSGKEVFAIGAGEIHPLLAADSSIISFAPHYSGSLFIGTENEVFYINPERQKVTLFKTGARDITLIDDDLFVIFQDNSSIKITNVSNYGILLAQSGR